MCTVPDQTVVNSNYLFFLIDNGIFIGNILTFNDVHIDIEKGNNPTCTNRYTFTHRTHNVASALLAPRSFLSSTFQSPPLAALTPYTTGYFCLFT